MTTIILSGPLPAGTYTLAPVKIPTPTPVTGVVWTAGSFGAGWQNDDWSAGCTLTHAATGILMQCTAPWGIWEAYATMLGGAPMTAAQSQLGSYDVSKFTTLEFNIVANQANSDMQVRLVPAGIEEPQSPFPLLSAYGKWADPGQLSTFDVPLKDFGIGSAMFPANLIRKLAAQDQSSIASSGGASYVIKSVVFK